MSSSGVIPSSTMAAAAAGVAAIRACAVEAAAQASQIPPPARATSALGACQWGRSPAPHWQQVFGSPTRVRSIAS